MAATGRSPWDARPAAKVTACCSAMPALPERFDQLADVVAVDRADVGEAELLPDHRVIDELLERVLHALAEFDPQLPLGQLFQQALEVGLEPVVALVGAHAREVFGDGADV